MQMQPIKPDNHRQRAPQEPGHIPPAELVGQLQVEDKKATSSSGNCEGAPGPAPTTAGAGDHHVQGLGETWPLVGGGASGWQGGTAEAGLQTRYHVKTQHHQGG